MSVAPQEYKICEALDAKRFPDDLHDRLLQLKLSGLTVHRLRHFAGTRVPDDLDFPGLNDFEIQVLVEDVLGMVFSELEEEAKVKEPLDQAEH